VNCDCSRGVLNPTNLERVLCLLNDDVLELSQPTQRFQLLSHDTNEGVQCLLDTRMIVYVEVLWAAMNYATSPSHHAKSVEFFIAAYRKQILSAIVVKAEDNRRHFKTDVSP